MLSPTQIHWLNASLAAVCPIDGLQLGPPVSIDFRSEATPEQRAAAAAVLAAFDPAAVEMQTLIAEARAMAAQKTPAAVSLLAFANVTYAAVLAGRKATNRLLAILGEGRFPTAAEVEQLRTTERPFSELLESWRELVPQVAASGNDKLP